LPVAGYYWHQNYKIFDIGLTARLWSRSAWFDQGASLIISITNFVQGKYFFTQFVSDLQQVGGFLLVLWFPTVRG
jgi:hypothetical protein